MLEVCVDSLASAIAAEQGGAHRLEVCGDLAVGGVTPSVTLIQSIQQHTQLPIMMMVRPRAGDFCYSAREQATMYTSIEMAKKMDLQGVVIGALTPESKVDKPLITNLVARCQGMEVTFHRAYDVCSEHRDVVQFLIDSGVNRLLTSGRASTAMAGSEHIGSLVSSYGKDICILAGSGLSAANVQELLRTTGVSEVHGSCRSSDSAHDTSEQVVADVVRLISDYRHKK